MAGTVGRELLGGANQLTVSGRVGGDLRAGSGTLRLADGAVVGGNLTYTTDAEDVIAPGAVVRGQIVRQAPERPAGPEPGPLAGPVDLLLGV